ncbi:aspartyl-phosphate phosphatase Spo0E family protein [Cohnella thailandensis]|uniref:Spo0E family sporulation regulatory protein-aspartic acid phosphatase n=1 Tax=Cohnella thailandensis TaxID=557557 RepID=A0A841T3M3_9BACL|nr:aspartyl-phosphate phosphatase Spo0E family protein [Cohnella thailandensis]MBB6635711.1 Spo0E family sporulation regulatory protein-aspartic acid phosphatase [Cohnella thailandensis]MBP1976087.1 hypothetical protein [Cohnella thailandensis]
MDSIIENCGLSELAAEVEAARAEMMKHAAAFLAPGGKPSEELIAVSQRLDKLVLQYMTMRFSADLRHPYSR